MKALALIPLLAATPVLADCPTGADLASGIRVIESDGTVSTYTSQADGIVQQDITSSDGFSARNLLGQGMHVLEVVDTENGSMMTDTSMTTVYDMTAADLPVPTESSRWSVSTMVNAFGEAYPETQTQTWGTAFTLAIGACSYQAIAGDITYESDGLKIDEVVHYIADLGISLLYSFDDNENEITTFIPVSIEAVQ